MENYKDDMDEYWFQSNNYETRKTKLIANDPTKHYPNKDEAKKLRKIMSDTGLTEEEVREDKKYRKILSDARKEGQKAKRSEDEKFYQNMIKKACKESKQAPQHPKTLEILDKLLSDRYNNTAWGRWFMVDQRNAKTVVKHYAK